MLKFGRVTVQLRGMVNLWKSFFCGRFLKFIERCKIDGKTYFVPLGIYINF